MTQKAEIKMRVGAGEYLELKINFFCLQAKAEPNTYAGPGN